jgi:hypothetical protein
VAGLFLRTERRELNPNLGGVGELKNVIANNVLKQRGFTDVVDSEGEVAGNRPGIRVSIIHLFIADRDFWRVIAVVADAGFPAAKATGDEVATAINRLAF